jgi:HEAT repeat protein
VALESSKRQFIDQALAPNELLDKSTLDNLSCLCSADLEYFKQLWVRTGVDHKLQVISQLVKLSQENFRFNFSEIFLYCLYDTDSRIRADAITGLAEEEDYHYISPLLIILKKDNDNNVREAAVKALGNFAILGATGKLSGNLINRIYDALLAILDDKNAGIDSKRLALEAIAPLHLPRVKDLIENAFRSPDTNLKASGLRAMGRNCDTYWLDMLRDSLRNDNRDLRYEAAIAITELGCEETLPDLIELSDDEDDRIQEAAVRGLGEVGGDEARSVLDELAKSPDQSVRHAAQLAIKELDYCNDPMNPNL